MIASVVKEDLAVATGSKPPVRMHQELLPDFGYVQLPTFSGPQVKCSVSV